MGVLGLHGWVGLASLSAVSRRSIPREGLSSVYTTRVIGCCHNRIKTSECRMSEWLQSQVRTNKNSNFFLYCETAITTLPTKLSAPRLDGIEVGTNI